MMSPMTEQEQFQCLNLLDMLSDLFTASEHQTFTKTDILLALDNVRELPVMFDPDVVIAQQLATREIL